MHKSQVDMLYSHSFSLQTVLATATGDVALSPILARIEEPSASQSAEHVTGLTFASDRFSLPLPSSSVFALHGGSCPSAPDDPNATNAGYDGSRSVFTR